MTFKWLIRLVEDIVRDGFENRSWFLSAAVLSLVVLGFVFAAAQVSAPFIYALF